MPLPRIMLKLKNLELDLWKIETLFPFYLPSRMFENDFTSMVKAGVLFAKNLITIKYNFCKIVVGTIASENR